MTQAEEISQAIATVERQISEAKSETAKKVLAKKLERLVNDLKKAKPSLTTLPKARKTVKSLNTKAFEELVEKLSKNPEYSFSRVPLQRWAQPQEFLPLQLMWVPIRRCLYFLLLLRTTHQ